MIIPILGKILGSGDVVEKGMTLAGKGDIDGVKAILGDFWIGEIMLLIVGFYFGGGLAETIQQRKGK